MKDVEYEYIEINNNSCTISKMAAKMAAEILNLMYLSSSFRYTEKGSVYSYDVKDVEYEYVEINNNSCIISKMAAKMAAKNSESNVSQLCFRMQRQIKCPFI